MNPLHLDAQLCFTLYAASRAMTAAYGPLLEPLGLTYPQYLVMLLLWERDEVSVKHLGDRLQLDSGTLTPVLKKLEAQRLVTRARDDVDARVVRIALTPQGKTLKRRAHGIPRALVCQTGLDLTAVATLREELAALTRTLREATTDEPKANTP